MNKRFIYIFLTGSLVVSGSFVFVIYLFFFADDSGSIFKGIRDSFSSKEEVLDKDLFTNEEDLPNIKKISKHPVVSGGFFVSNDLEKGTYMLYISKEKGHIYSVNLEENDLTLIYKNEDDFLSGVFKADWLNENYVVINQLIDNYDMKVSLIHFFEENEVLNVIKKDLPQKTNLSVSSPNKRSFFYLVEKGGGVEGFIRTIDSSGNISERYVFSSPIKEWLGSWSSENIINLTTKPSSYVPGHMYSVNSIDGSVSHTLRNIPGLVTKTNKVGSFTIYNQSDDESFDMMFYDYKNDKKIKINDIKTLVDKCVWKNEDVILCAVPDNIPSGVYPDDWYQGKVSFKDLYLKEINLKTKEVRTIVDFKEKEVSIDAVNLIFYNLKKSLFFIDKKTGFLWFYQDDES